MDFLVGSRIIFPAFANPPKRIIASGARNVAKSANASPKTFPVYSKTCNANLSLLRAAS